MKKQLVLASAFLFTFIPQSNVSAAITSSANAPTQSAQLETLVDDFVRLSLEAGTHDDEWVDAYYGPANKQMAAKANPRSIAELRAEAVRLMQAIAEVRHPEGRDAESFRQRTRALYGQTVAAYNRLQFLYGHRFKFDNEAKGLFGTIPQLKPLSYYDSILARLEKDIPGSGPLAARVDAFNDRFLIPKDRLKRVFDTAIAACRKRTAARMKLPKGESFTMEFVTGKPWSGYNYYKGNYKSLIQINTDLPIRISRAVDLGCHEGYPGHHVLNLMIEQKLVRQRGWREFEVNPLYSPQSVISEGSANYGIDLAFPEEERLKFERDKLFPLAGLDPAQARAYFDLQKATEALSGARLTIAKLYLDGEIDRTRAIELTQKYLLLSPARAEQSVGFTDHYRSYVINYGWGKDLVRHYIETGAPDSKTRWKRMEYLLSTPLQPDDLLREGGVPQP